MRVKMKAMLIKWMLPMIYDALISALATMSRQSTNSVDDKLVETLQDCKDDLLDELRCAL